MNTPSLSSPNFGDRFAAAWIENWNRRDIESILAHFTEDAQFESPIAATIVGSPILQGKQAIRDYWRAALERIKTLEFFLEGATWDPVRRTLLVMYRSRLDGRIAQACEVMIFDENGRQTKGLAYYGHTRES